MRIGAMMRSNVDREQSWLPVQKGALRDAAVRSDRDFIELPQKFAFLLFRIFAI
jgi:hypothetical protein